MPSTIAVYFNSGCLEASVAESILRDVGSKLGLSFSRASDFRDDNPEFTASRLPSWDDDKDNFLKFLTQRVGDLDVSMVNDTLIGTQIVVHEPSPDLDSYGW